MKNYIYCPSIKNKLRIIKNMKIIKIFLLVATVSFFTSIPFSANAEHCSHLEGSKKTICTFGFNVGDSNESKSSADTTKKKSNSGKSLLQKIKEMGGKNLGEKG